MRKSILAFVFIAHWTAHWMTMKACEHKEPEVNPYNGRPEMFHVESAIACFDEHQEKRSKEFTDKKKAWDFLDECLEGIGVVHVSCSDKSVEEFSE